MIIKNYLGEKTVLLTVVSAKKVLSNSTNWKKISFVFKNPWKFTGRSNRQLLFVFTYFLRYINFQNQFFFGNLIGDLWHYNTTRVKPEKNTSLIYIIYMYIIYMFGNNDMHGNFTWFQLCKSKHNNRFILPYSKCEFIPNPAQLLVVKPAQQL